MQSMAYHPDSRAQVSLSSLTKMSMFQGRSSSPVKGSISTNFCEKCKTKTMGKLQFPCGRVVILCEKCALSFFDVLVLKSSAKKVVWDTSGGSQRSSMKVTEEGGAAAAGQASFNWLRQKQQEGEIKLPDNLKSSYQKNLSSTIYPSKGRRQATLVCSIGVTIATCCSQLAGIGRRDGPQGSRDTLIPAHLARENSSILKSISDFERRQSRYGLKLSLSTDQTHSKEPLQTGRSADRDRKPGATGSMGMKSKEARRSSAITTSSKGLEKEVHMGTPIIVPPTYSSLSTSNAFPSIFKGTSSPLKNLRV